MRIPPPSRSFTIPLVAGACMAAAALVVSQSTISLAQPSAPASSGPTTAVNPAPSASRPTTSQNFFRSAGSNRDPGASNRDSGARGSDRRGSSTPSSGPASSAQLASISTLPPPFSRDFQVLQEKSVFSRNRSSAGSRDRGSTPSRVAQQFNFTGVVDVDGNPVAFVEDTAQGRILRIKVGEAVGRAKITRITLDALDFELNGVTSTLSVGSQIPTGETVAGFEPSAAPPGSSSPSSPGGGNDVMERMRQARLRAMGGAPPAPPSSTPPGSSNPSPAPANTQPTPDAPSPSGPGATSDNTTPNNAHHFTDDPGPDPGDMPGDFPPAQVFPPGAFPPG